MRDSRRQHGNNPLNTIIYLAIYLPILACAIVSIPFGRQKKMVEKGQLERKLQSCISTLKTQDADIKNLKLKLECYKTEKIKAYAKQLGLQESRPGQIVYLNRENSRLTPVFFQQEPQQNQPFQTATAINTRQAYGRN